MSSGKLLLNIAKFLLLAVVLYFVGRQIHGNWQSVTSYEWEIDWLRLGFALCLHLVTLVLFSAVWCILIAGYGYSVSLRDGFRIAYITSLGRYIPGKIWPVFGMAFLARQIGVRESASVSSWVIAMIFAITSSFLTAIMCLYASSSDVIRTALPHYSIPLVAAAIALASLVLVFFPNVAFGVFNRLLRLFKRPPVGFRMSISLALKVYLGYAVCWLFYGVSFWLLITSLTQTNVPLLTATGGFILAYQIGYLAFFAPGGFGVREYVLVALLSPYLGGVAVGVAVAARLWNLSAEIIATVAAYVMGRHTTPGESNSTSPDLQQPDS